MERRRGIETIIQTIGLYYKNINEKALLVTKENISKKTISSIGIGDEFVEGYDFYIFLNPEKSEIEKYKDKKILPDPNIAYFPYGIWVKGKRPLLISCDREGGELYGAIFFL